MDAQQAKPDQKQQEGVCGIGQYSFEFVLQGRPSPFCFAGHASG